MKNNSGLRINEAIDNGRAYDERHPQEVRYAPKPDVRASWFSAFCKEVKTSTRNFGRELKKWGERAAITLMCLVLFAFCYWCVVELITLPAAEDGGGWISDEGEAWFYGFWITLFAPITVVCGVLLMFVGNGSSRSSRPSQRPSQSQRRSVPPQSRVQPRQPPGTPDWWRECTRKRR